MCHAFVVPNSLSEDDPRRDPAVLLLQQFGASGDPPTLRAGTLFDGWRIGVYNKPQTLAS